MILIITHNNSDFDSLASVYFLSKLYKDSFILKPISFEEEVASYIKSSSLKFPFIEKIIPDKIELVIFADYPKNNEILKKYGLTNKKIAVYDHHSSNKYGSNIALLYSIFKNKIKDLSSEEALLALLGIYQDTGGLTYASTKSTDYMASSFFLKFKPHIEKIPYYLKYFDLNDKALEIISAISKNATVMGPSISKVIISKYEVKDYYKGYSILLNHLLNIKKVSAIFVIFIFKKRIILTGRSIDPFLNVNEILNNIKKGNGHSLASSRIFKGGDAHIIKRKLQLVVTDYVFSQKLSLFLDKVKLDPEFFVQKQKNIIGTHRTLWEYFDLISKGKKTIISYKNKYIGEKVKKLLLPQVLITSPMLSFHDRKKNNIAVSLKKYISRAFPEKVKNLIKLILAISEKENVRIFIVGGIPRELMLRYLRNEEGFPFQEIDLVVEGKNAITIAKRLYKNMKNGKLHTYKEFKTATIKIPKEELDMDKDLSLDFATARKEHYQYGGALPIVKDTDLENDLYRRDFTINSIAISLNKGEFGAIYDYFGGQNDLKNKRLRILHQKSFFDDPTRVLRLIRFKNNLDFMIEKKTEKILQFSLNFGITEAIKGLRLTRELKLIFESQRPINGIETLEKYDLIYEMFGIDKLNIDEIKNLNNGINWFIRLYPGTEIKKYLIFFGYFLRLSKKIGIDETFAFNKKEHKIIDEICHLKKTQLTGNSRFSTFDKHFNWLSIEAKIFQITQFEGRTKEKYIQYLLKLIKYRPRLNGSEVKERGYKNEEIGIFLTKERHRWLDM